MNERPPTPPHAPPFTRGQRGVVIYGIIGFVSLLVVLQLWLLTATMNAYLGGDESPILPALVVSVACFALNGGLLYYIYAMERR